MRLPSRLAVVLFAGFVLIHPDLGAQSAAPDLSLPAGAGERASPEAPPYRAKLFWDRHGPDWAIFWDPALDTPRLVSPRTKLRLLPEGSVVDEASLAQAVRDFVSADRAFFGLTGDDLLGPSARRIDGNWLLAFRQGAGGLPVRGANLRFLVSPEKRHPPYRRVPLARRAGAIGRSSRRGGGADRGPGGI
ncbi:MAG: hypothetical protein HY717_03140 [Planctomycetes bacterium]|nr:hypothetical protein [Planctomycetota bacterium]